MGVPLRESEADMVRFLIAVVVAAAVNMYLTLGCGWQPLDWA